MNIRKEIFYFLWIPIGFAYLWMGYSWYQTAYWSTVDGCSWEYYFSMILIIVGYIQVCVCIIFNIYRFIKKALFDYVEKIVNNILDMEN